MIGSIWQYLLLIFLISLLNFNIADTGMTIKSDDLSSLARKHSEINSETVEMPKMKILYCTS